MQSIPITNNAPGDDLSTKSRVLEAGASMLQSFEPTTQICGHLNAFHVYADEPGRFVEANHYCSHLNEDVRQCLLYDSPDRGARLIGIEYMITPKLFATLPESERKYWHTHVYEVKSGMLIMPKPASIPANLWEIAENKEMEQVIQLYGKVYHLWQVDRGDMLPMGEPKLMMSFTQDGQMDFETVVKERDRRFGEDYERKKHIRKDISEPVLQPGADSL
ncbi:hypothetical protein C8J56DRAFT_1005272 [Mycena floridula]|nr:hypothetical protein C8J56DRAFT_1005272 [Mycena floridula]